MCYFHNSYWNITQNTFLNNINSIFISSFFHNVSIYFTYILEFANHLRTRLNTLCTFLSDSRNIPQGGDSTAFFILPTFLILYSINKRMLYAHAITVLIFSPNFLRQLLPWRRPLREKLCCCVVAANLIASFYFLFLLPRSSLGFAVMVNPPPSSGFHYEFLFKKRLRPGFGFLS